MSKPATAMLRQWHEEIAAELVDARAALAPARQRLQTEEEKARDEARRREELSVLIKKCVVGAESIATALSQRLADYMHELQTALVRPAKQGLEAVEYRISDLETALAQISRAMHVAEPESQAERAVVVSMRRPAAEFDPIEMPPRGVA